MSTQLTGVGAGKIWGYWLPRAGLLRQFTGAAELHLTHCPMSGVALSQLSLSAAPTQSVLTIAYADVSMKQNWLTLAPQLL